jgi:hypothetical protein
MDVRLHSKWLEAHPASISSSSGLTWWLTRGCCLHEVGLALKTWSSWSSLSRHGWSWEDSTAWSLGRVESCPCGWCRKNTYASTNPGRDVNEMLWCVAATRGGRASGIRVGSCHWDTAARNPTHAHSAWQEEESQKFLVLLTMRAFCTSYIFNAIVIYLGTIIFFLLRLIS